MGMSEREHHIKVLGNLLSHYKARKKCEGYYDSTLKDSIEALQYAISSLKTDLKYDLMYEEEKIYTKADILAMFEELHNEIEEIEKFTNTFGWELRAKTPEEIKKECSEIIQQKINTLKESKDE